MVAVSALPIFVGAEQNIQKPYGDIEFNSYGNGSYEIKVKNVKEPLVLKFSEGTESFFASVQNGSTLSHPFGDYMGEELYIQLISADKKYVYESILFNLQTGKATYQYDISQYDYGKLTHELYDKIPFTLGAVKLSNPKTNEITFKSIKRDVTLYDFEAHAIIQLPATTTPVTYEIPSEVYIMMDSETREEVGELHLNKEKGYTLDPPIATTYYMYEYKKRVRSADEDLSHLTKDMPKVIKPKVVKMTTSKSYFEKTAAQIASEKFVMIDQTKLKDLGTSSHRDAIVLLNKMGIINGYEDGTFKPNKTLRFSDIIKLVGRYAKVPVLEKSQITTAMTEKYNTKDIEVISYMKELEQVFGSNVSFSKDVTRGEFAIILANFIEYMTQQNGKQINLAQFINLRKFESNYVVKNQAYKEAVTVLDYFGITKIPDGQFNDDQTLNRGQLASFLTRIYAINFDHIQ